MSESRSKVHLERSSLIKVLIILAVFGIVHQWYLVEFPDEEELTIATFSFSISAIAAGIAAFIVGRRYLGTKVFGITYISLTIAFFFLTVGDLTYIYYGWFTEEAPYPSIADVFYLLFYPFVGYHLVRNIKNIKKKFKWSSQFGVILVTATIVGIFAFMSIDMIEEKPFDFYYGLIFVSASASIFSLALLGLTVFRNSILGSAWLLLSGALFLTTVADVWYYYLEIVGEYTGAHFVNTLWVLANLTIMYALYKHKKTI